MSTAREPPTPGNPRLKHLRRLLGRRSARREAGQYVVEGPTLVVEALAGPADVVEVYADADWLAEHPDTLPTTGVPRWPVRPGGLARVLDTVTPQPVAALVTLPVVDLADLGPAAGALVVALDGVADPGNVGTILRSAAGAGDAGVLLGAGCADPWGPKAVRASAGAVQRLAVVEAALPSALAALADGGRRIVVAAAGGGTCPEDLDLARPTVLVLGSEAHGVTPEVAALADEIVAIPVASGTESLNVAMAATVLLFEAARQRRSRSATDGRPAGPTA